MPPVAAVPLIAAGIGAGGSVAGSLINANASQPKNVPVPPPNPLFPGQQQSYLNSLNSSGVGPTSLSTIASDAATGNPTNLSPLFTALQASMKQSQDAGAADLVEQFGSKGLRNSSDLLKAGANYEEQSTKDFSTIIAQYTQQAAEAAANRQLQAATLGASLVESPALAETPSSVLTSGGTSPAGAALSSGGSAIQQLLLMKELYPDLFNTGSTSNPATAEVPIGTGVE